MPILTTIIAGATSGWNWLVSNPIAKKIAIWGAALLAAYIGYRTWKGNIEKGVRRQERDAFARQQAEEHARTVETVQRVGQETENAKDRALEAPSHVSDVSSADELRTRYPDNASVILRPRGTSGGQGPR